MRRSFVLTPIGIILSIFLVLGGIAIQSNATNADSSQTSSTKIRYLTDTQWTAKMVQIYGPEAAKASRVKMQFDLGSKSITANLTPIPHQSSNWCGYHLDNGTNTTIYGVIGQFNARQCTGTNAEDSEWVGMAGDNPALPNLLQIGIDMKSMIAFWQELPGVPFPMINQILQTVLKCPAI
jgi:hypothetical protein